jgi:hypothetical protein
MLGSLWRGRDVRVADEIGRGVGCRGMKLVGG